MQLLVTSNYITFLEMKSKVLAVGILQQALLKIFKRVSIFYVIVEM